MKGTGQSTRLDLLNRKCVFVLTPEKATAELGSLRLGRSNSDTISRSPICTPLCPKVDVYPAKFATL